MVASQSYAHNIFRLQEFGYWNLIFIKSLMNFLLVSAIDEHLRTTIFINLLHARVVICEGLEEESFNLSDMITQP